MKNIIKRNDGRWQWNKTINGNRTFIYAKTQKELLKKIKDFKQNLKTINTKEKTSKIIAIDLIWDWYNTYKKDIVSAHNYKYAINKYFNIPIFKKNINKITLEELEKFITNIKFGRTQTYCYYIIKGVFEIAYKKKYIKENIALDISKPKHQRKKGESFNLKEQKLILENLDKSEMKYEILFYLLTGCRRAEASKITKNDIDFDNLSIFINGTKTASAKRNIPISKTFAEILRKNLKNMFKREISSYSNIFQKYLKLLNIKNHKLHDLRHTFSTNLYYLGVPDKERQYYLGHSSIVITNDIYTHLNPNIKKEDILNLYKDLYPQF